MDFMDKVAEIDLSELSALNAKIQEGNAKIKEYQRAVELYNIIMQAQRNLIDTVISQNAAIMETNKSLMQDCNQLAWVAHHYSSGDMHGTA